MENSDYSQFLGNATSTGVQETSEVKKAKVQQKKIYRELLVPTSNFDAVAWISKFSKYITPQTKIFYSVLTSDILYEEEEKLTYLSANIEMIIERTQKGSCQQLNNQDNKFILPENIYKFLLKFYDHITLALTQRSVYKANAEEIKQTSAGIISDQISKSQEKFTTQLLGLISIFTALSFVIFGSISSLNSLFENAKESPIIRIVLVAVLWMLCMTNVFMLFIKLICRLVDKNISMKGYFIYINLVLLLFLVVILYKTLIADVLNVPPTLKALFKIHHSG